MDQKTFDHVSFLMEFGIIFWPKWSRRPPREGEPSREARWPPDCFFYDFGVHLGTHSEPKSCEKYILEAFAKQISYVVRFLFV